MNLRHIYLISLGVVATLGTEHAYAQKQAEAAKAAPAPKLTKAPKVRHWVSAKLPDGTQIPSEGASVLLEVSIGEDGLVKAASVKQGRGSPFDEAALEAVRSFEFEPAELDDKPAAVTIDYRYDFAQVAAAAPKPPAQAHYEGIVRNRKTKLPLSGAVVELDSSTRATTDEQGRFVFNQVPPGTHNVWISGPGIPPVGTEETLEPGSRYQALYDVEIPEADISPDESNDFELVVFAPRLDKKVAATEVSAEQGAKVAGTGGDVVKVVENLPGVARTAVGSGALVVWGASAQDTRVYVDGVRIPALYHEGGYRSVIHSDLVRSVELQPGGYGASYGRGLGGLVTVGLRSLSESGQHGSIGADIIDASASTRGSIGEKVRYAIAGRRSHLDWMLNRFTDEDPGQYVPIPRYWDGQARIMYFPTPGESVEFGAMASSDYIERNRASADPGDTKKETRDTGFTRYYARYRRDFDNSSSAILTPWFGFEHTDTSNTVGSVPAKQNSSSSVWGMRAEWQGRAHKNIILDAGVDLEIIQTTVSRIGSVTTPAREGDARVFGQAPANQINADHWDTTTAGLSPFIQADLAFLNDRLHIIPGLRFEPLLTRASQVVPATSTSPAIGTQSLSAPVDPRLAIRWQLNSSITAKAAVGVYHQAPVGEDLSAVYGNPKLGVSRAVHYLVGGNFQISEPLTIEVTSFFSRMYDVAVRNPAESPLIAQSLLGTGEGRAYGTQFMLRHNPIGRFFGWISMSVIRSERTDPRTGEYRPFDFDQTYVFTALGSYDLGRGFEIGGRARWSTGYPRTPVTSAVYNSQTDSYQPVFGSLNSTRIPNFYQIDLRIAKRFKLGNESNAEVYLDLQNVTNHSNPEEIVYNYNYTNKSYITGLPLLPVLGGKLTW